MKTDPIQKANIRRFFICLALLCLVPGSTARSIYRMLTVSPMTLRRFEVLFRMDPGACIAIVLYLICAVIMLVSAIRILLRAIGRGHADVRRDYMPRKRNTGKTEAAISCEHSRGMEKYLEQINGFLASGLIDRAEYNVLRERYKKLNVPRDYH